MKHLPGSYVRIVLLLVTLLIWIWVFNQDFQSWLNLTIITGGILLTIPVVFFGRWLLEMYAWTRKPKP